MLQVNKAVRTKRTEKQWVNMGTISTLACFVIPNTCGSAGGALSVWMKILECSKETGVITSMNTGEISEGFLVTCDDGDL